MVGSLADAEDIVQDTYLKWLSIDHRKIKNTKSYLIKAVTNNCINHLNSLKRKKEEYLDTVDLGNLFDRYFHFEFDKLDLEHEVRGALQLLHKKLEPLERAIFILREVFDFDYDDLQALFGKKQDNCRQIFCRAKEKLQRGTQNLKNDITLPADFLHHFTNACRLGVCSNFLHDLKNDVAAKLKMGG